MKSTGRPWAKLDAGYYDDEKIIAAGPMAELLFVRGIAFCRARMNDGFIRTEQLPRIAVGIENMEEAKRDHHLLALSEGLKARRLFMPRDLVTIAQGDEETNVIPLNDRPDAGLATLAEEEASDEFEEMTAEELAAQKDRPGNEEEAES